MKKRSNRLQVAARLLLGMVVMLCGTAAHAIATCSGGGGTTTLSLPATITVSPDTPTGTNLTGWVYAGAGNSFLCSSPANDGYGAIVNYAGTQARSGITIPLPPGGSGAASVYRTNIQGIGVAVAALAILGNNNCGWTNWSGGNPTSTTGQIIGAACYWLNPLNNVSVSARVGVALVKLDGAVSAGQLASQRVMVLNAGTYSNPVDPMSQARGSWAPHYFVISGVNVVARTCSVTTTSVTIPLGNVAASALPAVGRFTTAPSPQNVSLSCSGNPSVSMTMQGTQAAGAPNTVLALTSGASVAQGVGVQLLYNNALLAINAPVIVSTSAANRLDVPISARYYRFGNITAGTANARATLQFTYN